MNPLEQYPGVRSALYLIQWITTGLTGALGIYFQASGGDVPQWYNIAVLILAFVWTYTGITARANTPTVNRQRDERGNFQANTVWVILGIIGLVLIVLAIVDQIRV